MLCFRLHFTKDNITNNTAAATVRQVVTVVFERMVAEDERYKGTTGFVLLQPKSIYSSEGRNVELGENAEECTGSTTPVKLNIT